MKKIILSIIIFLFFIFVFAFGIVNIYPSFNFNKFISNKELKDENIISRFDLKIIEKEKSAPLPTTIPSPSPTPSPKPLTFVEMNKLYGPCVKLPTLMYHRVQTIESAEKNKQTSVSVYTDVFLSQMQYLKDKNYTVLSMQDLINFFNQGISIPTKGVLLTFDDGYENFYTDAYPILRGFNYPATVFLATGLVDNPNYLNWGQIKEMKVNNILFANHTWSHKSVATTFDVMKMEIDTAEIQLQEKNLNFSKVFAFPYGAFIPQVNKYLSSSGYNLAFTTQPGNILCNAKRLELPRVRIGNFPLSVYGF